jgi:hypothetical protein
MPLPPTTDFLYRVAPITQHVSEPLRTEACAISLKTGGVFGIGIVGAPYYAEFDHPLGKVVGIEEVAPIVTDAIASPTGKACPGLPRVFYFLIHHLEEGKQETLAVRCTHDDEGRMSLAQADLVSLMDAWCGK